MAGDAVVTTRLGLALAFAVIAPSATAATLYKCRGADNVPLYTASPVAGSTCEAVSNFMHDKRAESGPDEGWRFVGATDQYSFYFFDKNISTKAGKTAVWTMASYTKLQAGQASQNYSAHASVLERTIVDCAERASAVMQRAYYTEAYGKGLAAGTWQALHTPPLSYAVPNTLGDMLVTAVCKGPKK
ncbi:surface-adhesin E family protein [Pseudoxanthomonas mexicana]